ncbi:MAG: TonB-dependent receptor [Candidatus Omnitrophota bacterium]
MIIRCGIIFLFLFSASFSFAGQPYPLDKIVVSKSTGISNNYSLQISQLEDSSARSLPEAIGFLGIDTQARSLGYGVQTDFSLRGLGFESLAISLDGQRLNDPQTGHHNGDIPLALGDIERIELNALKGIVNIVSKSPWDSKNSFMFSSGQHQTLATRLSLVNKSDNLSLRFSLEQKESAGYRYDTDFEISTGSLSSNLRFNQEQEANLFLGYDEKEFGAYDFYTPNSGYPSKEWTKTLIVSAGLNLNTDSFLFKPKFLWRRHYDKFMLDKTQIKSSYLNHHYTDVYTTGLSAQIFEGFFDHFVLAAQYQQEMINSRRLGGHIRGQGSVSMDIQKALSERIFLDNSLAYNFFDSFKNRVTGSMALVYSFPFNQRVSLGVSNTIRKPSFTELYYQDPTTIGSDYLVSEKSFTYQLGYDYYPEGFNIGLVAFFRQEDDLINWVKQVPGDNWQAMNMLKADCFGIESYFSIRLNPVFNLSFNYSYLDRSLKDSGWLYKYGQNYATHLLNSFVEFDLPFFSSSIELQYKKRPQRNGWLLTNLSLWRKLDFKEAGPSKKAGEDARIFCRINNLFNVGYQDIEGIPSPGRWVEAGIRWQW